MKKAALYAALTWAAFHLGGCQTAVEPSASRDPDAEKRAANDSCPRPPALPSHHPDHKTGEKVYDLRPTGRHEMSLRCIGATGIRARVYKPVILKVEGVIPGSPADGKFETGQIIAGVNGETFEGRDLFVVLGEALTEAEATDGRMVFSVKEDETAEPKDVEVTIPVFGAYSSTWPIDCEKSEAIVARAAEFYARTRLYADNNHGDRGEHLKSHGIGGALACLFLLSTGEDKYLPRVKEYFDHLAQDIEGIGDSTWNNGYNGIACAEYYLRTGDRSVLPVIQYYCDDARKRQKFGCGWVHWGQNVNPRYVAGGLMNPAGTQLLTMLLLAKECGADVDEKTLLGALRFWYRFVGHGTVPYGDHRGEGGLGSNGKDGMCAAAMRIASNAQGDATIYARATRTLSMSTLTSYPSLIRGHADHGRGDGIWRGVASSYMLDSDPEAYHAAMNRLKWWYDLSRRPSGALGLATCQRFDDIGSGAGAALAYTAPLKTLRITGAPRSKYAKGFSLPARIWGNEADLEFLSTEHGARYLEGGAEEPIHVLFYRYGSAYKGTSGLDDVQRKEIVRNCHHKRYMIRSQAAKALRIVGAFDEIEKLLRDPDPRVRRAALDGMADYRYWFHVGKNPMKPEQFTPAMVEAIRSMLKNPDEAVYVVDGALMALSLASAKDIGEALPLIMPWTTHEEWWLRQSAFRALATAANDEEFLPRVLPTMLDMLLKEDHTMPRQNMVGALNRLIKKHGIASLAGGQIVDAHLKAVETRRIDPGLRAGEGEYDVGQSIDVLFKNAPARALEVARLVARRLPALTTKMITSVAGRLRESLEKVPGDQRAELEGLLYGTYRQALVARMKKDGPNLGLLETIGSLTALREEVGAWQPLGRLLPDERVWRFTSFEPADKDALHPREGKRFRDVALPGGLEGWTDPAFNDDKWERGTAPIGKGVFKAKRKPAPFENISTWGDGEFLLMRTTFELESLGHDYYRIAVLANQGYYIYLNGKLIQTYIWWAGPHYRKILISPENAKLLRVGTNSLAMYTNAQYVDGKQMGQADLYLEGLKTSDVLGEGR